MKPYMETPQDITIQPQDGEPFIKTPQEEYNTASGYQALYLKHHRKI